MMPSSKPGTVFTAGCWSTAGPRCPGLGGSHWAKISKRFVESEFWAGYWGISFFIWLYWRGWQWEEGQHEKNSICLGSTKPSHRIYINIVIAIGSTQVLSVVTLLSALTADISCWQLWQHMQTIGSQDKYKRLNCILQDLSRNTLLDHIWQIWERIWARQIYALDLRR